MVRGEGKEQRRKGGKYFRKKKTEKKGGKHFNLSKFLAKVLIP